MWPDLGEPTELSHLLKIDFLHRTAWNDEYYHLVKNIPSYICMQYIDN